MTGDDQIYSDRQIAAALRADKTIDIITIGAKTGSQRKTEIWFHLVGERIIICGTPSADGNQGPYKPRDWLANLRAHPEFTFCLKESISAQLPARALIVTDPADRRELLSAPETRWYRQQVADFEELLVRGPVIEVILMRAGRPWFPLAASYTVSESS